MICTIHVGNTHITAVLWKGNTLRTRVRLKTHAGDLSSLRRMLALDHRDTVVIAGVVPAVMNRLRAYVRKVSCARMCEVGKDLNVPMKSRYRKPSSLGVDRLLCAYAAFRASAQPLIVLDAGTAITIDAVSKKGVFLGGVIVPGLQMSLDALHARTALLPGCRLKDPGKLIGVDTTSCMLSGVVRGTAALCDALIRDMKKIVGPHAEIVYTGGDASLLKRYSRHYAVVREDLVLSAMRLLISE